MPTKKIKEWIEFLKHDLWRFRIQQLPGGKSRLVRLLRVLVLSLRGFHEDECHLHASALTLFTLLSLVPVVALAFGIAQGFKLKESLAEWLSKTLKDFPEVVKHVTDYANTLLEKTEGGLVAGIGVILLFWAVIKLLGRIERSFNSIWGVKKDRAIGRKLADYTLVLVLSPVLFVISSSVTQKIAETESLTKSLGSVDTALRPVSFLATLILFTILYVLMPNTRVRLIPGLVAGVVAGTIFQGLQWVYVTFQISVASYNAIYGSLAALPLFLIWIHLNWLVVLFGAEISFSWQNVETFAFEPDCLRVSGRFKRLLALRITHLLVKRFDGEEKPLSAAQLSQELEIPIRLVNEILFELMGAGIVSETRENSSQDVYYQIARPLERITVGYVCKVLDERGTDTIPVAESEELEKLSRCLQQFSEAVENSPGNMVLRDI